jgi:hypothetical protein
MVGNCLKSLFSSRINAFFVSSTLIYGSYFFSGQKESTNHFRPQYVMQVSICCGAVLNLEITAIVQKFYVFLFHQKQKETEEWYQKKA